MPFEEFVRRGSQRASAPLVTLQASGIFNLNKEAVEELAASLPQGEVPEAVVLLYDRDAQVVGFRPADPTLEHAYRLRTDPKSSSRLITGRAFCRNYQIPTDRGRRYAAEMQDGVLTIDLKSAPAPTRTPRPKAAR